MGFAVCFWALWWLSCVNRMCRCQNTVKNVSSPALKPVLIHSPFFFEHLGRYFVSIECTIANIRAKLFLGWLLNRFYGIHIFLCALWCFFGQFDIPLPKYVQKRYFFTYEIVFTAVAVLFWALWWLFCIDRTYRCQDTGENVTLPDLKLVLRHSGFF